jgi:hypothetical protein
MIILSPKTSSKLSVNPSSYYKRMCMCVLQTLTNDFHHDAGTAQGSIRSHTIGYALAASGAVDAAWDSTAAAAVQGLSQQMSSTL